MIYVNDYDVYLRGKKIDCVMCYEDFGLMGSIHAFCGEPRLCLHYISDAGIYRIETIAASRVRLISKKTRTPYHYGA